MKSFILAVIATVVIPVSAHAQSDRWVATAQSVNATAYVDSTHIIIDGDIRTVWTKWVYKVAQTDHGVTYSQALVNYSYDCRRRTMTGKDMVLQDAGGATVYSMHDAAPQTQAVPPQTTSELVLDYICKRK